MSSTVITAESLKSAGVSDAHLREAAFKNTAVSPTVLSQQQQKAAALGFNFDQLVKVFGGFLPLVIQFLALLQNPTPTPSK